MNLINLSLKLNNYPIGKAISHLKSIQDLDDTSFEEYLIQQRKSILKYHLANNGFYKKLIASTVPPEDWLAVPIMTKKDLQHPLNQLLSNGLSLKNMYVGKTSGSTGDPFYFAKDKFAHALTWAVIRDRFNRFGLFGKLQARFYGAPKEFRANIKERFKDFLGNRHNFDVFDLSDAAFDKWLLGFRRNKYVYLNGYTTVILAFAHYLDRKNIVLKDLCNSLQACVVTSEMCFESDVEIMERAFGIPVVKEYGASELDVIAFQNKRGQWMLNTETLFVEILDEKNRPLPYGETGRIVITSLYNKAQPFIRYDIGDIGSINYFSTKKVLLKTLEGRREDLVHLPSGKITPGLTFYYVTKSVMQKDCQVKEIKVIQSKLDKFEIHYVADNELDTKNKETIKKALDKYLEPDLNVCFYHVDRLERTGSGKLKQFTSLLKR